MIFSINRLFNLDYIPTYSENSVEAGRDGGGGGYISMSDHH